MNLVDRLISSLDKGEEKISELDGIYEEITQCVTEKLKGNRGAAIF